MASLDTGWVGAAWENQSGLPDAVLLPTIRETASYLQQWTREQRATKGRSGMFDRTKFTAPEGPYEQMRMAHTAIQDDDVVSAAADVTEGLILQGTSWESSNEAAADIMNQIAGKIDLDGYLRTAYRENFTYSQTVTATWWGWKTYTSTTRKTADATNKNGSARTYPGRAKFKLFAPTKIITLDPTCVVPVGMAIFGDERLAWHATEEMIAAWSGMEEQPLMNFDAVMAGLFKGVYTPTREEEVWLGKLGIDPRRLIEFNPDRVWRHTRTKAAYQPFADLRMKAVFRLLDLKQQLLESDRVMLVGAANYLLLVKKGSVDQPAAQSEVDNLKEGFNVLAKLPVIVSDHRLTIEIISPKLDTTLIADKYNTLDSRILARLFGAPSINSGARGDQNAGITTRMMARTLESQRHMLRRMVEKEIRDQIWDHPYNAEVLKKFKPEEKPSLAFTPRNVQLDNDAQIIAAIMAARQSRDLSRESFLESFGFDQAVEHQRIVREADLYDDDFKTTVPFTAGAGGDPAKVGDGQGGAPSAVTGAQGGRPVGGGSPKKSAQSQVKKRTASGAPSVGGAGS